MNHKTKDEAIEYRPCRHTREQEQEGKKAVAYVSERVVKLIADLRRKKTTPPPVRHSDSGFDKEIGEVKEHFHRLRRLLKVSRYKEQVDIFEKAQQEFLSSRPCCLHEVMECGLSPFAILPIKEIPGMIKPWELPTPRTGGRKSSPRVQKRYLLIANLKGRGLSSIEICRELDQRNHPVPLEWKQEGISGWERAYIQNKSRNISKLFSDAKKKAPRIIK